MGPATSAAVGTTRDAALVVVVTAAAASSRLLRAARAFLFLLVGWEGEPCDEGVGLLMHKQEMGRDASFFLISHLSTSIRSKIRSAEPAACAHMCTCVSVRTKSMR